MSKLRMYFVSYTTGTTWGHTGSFVLSSNKVGKEHIRHGLHKAKEYLPDQAYAERVVLLAFNEIPSE